MGAASAWLRTLHQTPCQSSLTCEEDSEIFEYIHLGHQLIPNTQTYPTLPFSGWQP